MIGSVSLSQVSPVAPAREVQAAAAAGSGAASSPAFTKISRSGELLSKFQELAQTDPSKLKATLDRVSQDLRASAQGAIGAQADTLNDFADRFARAAAAGDVSALNLSAHHRHHAPSGSSVVAPATTGGGAGASAIGTGTAQVDPASQATMDSVLAQVDQALGMNPPPFGPWFTL